MSVELFERHRALLDLASGAIATRGPFSAFSSNPADCNEIAAAQGREAFSNYCDSFFYLDQPGVGERVGEEVSPYGFTLGVQYPKTNLNAILPAAQRARDAWSKSSIETRAGVCLEILHQLHARSFEMALAAMHTTGAPFEFAYAHSGAHALERALEAIALSYQEMRAIPLEVAWDQTAEGRVTRFVKTFRLQGLGIGLVIGCSTQPNWNAYPAVFANLMTGNAVVIKPHPQAVLPLAITIGVVRQVLKEAGFDANLATLVVDESSRPVTATAACRPEVRIVDYTGNPDFAAWLASNAHQARVHLHTGAVNPVIVDGTADLHGMLRNIAISASLNGGRMCTSPRVIFTHREGVGVAGGRLESEQFDALLAQHFERVLAEPAAAAEILGAFRHGEAEAMIEWLIPNGDVVVESRLLPHPGFPGATIRTPLVLRLRQDQEDIYAREWFGPILLLVECENVAETIAKASKLVRSRGALVASVYSEDAGARGAAAEALSAAGAAVCVNFAGDSLMNLAAAFSDFHGSAMNPSGNSTLVDSAFVVGRFRVAESRVQV